MVTVPTQGCYEGEPLGREKVPTGHPGVGGWVGAGPVLAGYDAHEHREVMPQGSASLQ